MAVRKKKVENDPDLRKQRKALRILALKARLEELQSKLNVAIEGLLDEDPKKGERWDDGNYEVLISEKKELTLTKEQKADLVVRYGKKVIREAFSVPDFRKLRGGDKDLEQEFPEVETKAISVRNIAKKKTPVTSGKK